MCGVVECLEVLVGFCECFVCLGVAVYVFCCVESEVLAGV